MANFQLGETVICSIEIRNSAGTLVDPETSMTISISDPHNGSEVKNQAMIPDSTGKYHYDFTPSSTSLRGKYQVQYKATDGARITIAVDTFMVE